MSYCKKLYDGLDKRLDEHKTIDQIAEEMCPEVSKKRDKILKLIKSEKGTDWLFENHEWLGYRVDCIHNPTGGKIKNPNSTQRLSVASLRTKNPSKKQFGIWIEELNKIIDTVEDIDNDFVDTTMSKHRVKLRALVKRTRELRMILNAKLR